MSDSTRPYKDVPRSKLRQRLRDIDEERSVWVTLVDTNQTKLDLLEESLNVKQKTLFGYKTVKLEADLEHFKKTMPLMHQQSEAHRHRTQLAQEIQDINVELHIRDTPALAQEFGPGID